MGDNWYLSYSRFSEFGGTIYRVSDSPFGVWRTPRHDRIGNRRFYAAKSMADNAGRRYYFGWIPDRANNSDIGEWYWGGIFAVPHEVAPSLKNRELEVKLPSQIAQAYQNPIEWTYKAVAGNSSLAGDKKIRVDSVGTLTYGFFEFSGKSFLLSCRVKPIDCRDNMGFVIKSDQDLSTCLLLILEQGAQRISLLKYPMPVDPFWEASVASMVAAALPGPDGPRVAESHFEYDDGFPIEIKILIEHDLVEAFVGEKVALTYRCYDAAEYEIGIIVQDGNAEYRRDNLYGMTRQRLSFADIRILERSHQKRHAPSRAKPLPQLTRAQSSGALPAQAQLLGQGAHALPALACGGQLDKETHPSPIPCSSLPYPNGTRTSQSRFWSAPTCCGANYVWGVPA